MNGRDASEVVVLTGASAGVGRAVARRFAQDGARLVLVARGRKGLEGAKSDVERLGGQAVVLQGDVADPDTHERAAEAAESQFGPIDIWINSAMVSVFSPFHEMRADEFKRVVEVTCLGQVYGTHAALGRMRPRGYGTIVLVGSALAYRGIPLQSAYCASKHAVQGFLDSLRTELLHAKSRVHVTMVQLPAVNTPQFDWVKSRLPNRAQPVPPIYQPEVIADGIHWAAHERRREVSIGVSTDVAIIGNKIAPGLGDWYLAKTGFASQQTDEPEDPARPDNLWEPVDEHRDFGAHGRFDTHALDSSNQLWFTKHRLGVGAALAAGAGVLAMTMAMAAAGRGAAKQPKGKKQTAEHRWPRGGEEAGTGI